MLHVLLPTEVFRSTASARHLTFSQSVSGYPIPLVSLLEGPRSVWGVSNMILDAILIVDLRTVLQQ